ncbi:MULTISPECIES: hypothetical protein [unclassified Nitrosomonas]|uniref:hypothetical protein n=1 Tax=unclassified Nitrosomonas TaxID=2609265 RepID=UPI000887D393|nr:MULTISPECIES: hypothetical protein [unclassified Nitrosomonas]SDH26987.1 hypothetical protein SAMN05428952_100965 [Nitrosomonas sp. Nm132]SDY38942.1 hypothetical protein SAMN05421754_100863 [Nitrosomonas sp. Nm58]
MIDDLKDRSRRQLGELAVMQHRINESEKLILKRAETRLDEVNARIQQIRSSSLDQSQEYMNLIKERGLLHMIIAQAKASIRI